MALTELICGLDIDLSDKETFAELLIGMGIHGEKAQAIAQHVAPGQFLVNFGQLENLLGSELAVKAVSEGGYFLEYSNGELRDYMNKACMAATKMEADFGTVPQGFTPWFNSNETLDAYFGQDKHQKTRVDTSKMEKVLFYRILKQEDPTSRRYLNALISDGNLVIGENERWNKKNEGARGLNIAIQLSKQLYNIFSELGLKDPGCHIEHNQRRITIPHATQDVLRLIRSHAYSHQEQAAIA